MLEDRSLAEHFVRRISGRLSKLVDDIRQVESSLARPTPPLAGASRSNASSAVNLSVFH
jgi:hypothetical protein